MLIDKKEALRKLKKTKPGLAKKEIVEQTGSYLFKDGKVITFNDEISVSAPFPVGFEGAVAAGRLYRALEGAPTETVDLRNWK